MEGSIYITGDIGSFGDVVGVQLVDVIQQVKKYPSATSFTVYIDSEGGEVETGFDIYNYLRSLGLPIKTVGTGKVMSIATVVFLAGDTRVLRKSSEFMIHLPAGGIATATAAEIADYAEFVKGVEKRLIDFYKKATNTTEEAIRPLLKNETFLTGQQAIDLGFATEVDSTVTAKAKLIINSKPKEDMTISKEDKSWIEAKFDAIMAKFKPAKVVALRLTAADGSTMVEFPDVADDATPVAGDIATVDGVPATGEILMPDGFIYVFAEDGTGALVEMKPQESGDDDSEEMARLREENERLTAEVATAKAEASAAVARLNDVEKEVKALKSSITSRFKTEPQAPPKKKDEGVTARRVLKAEHYKD